MLVSRRYLSVDDLCQSEIVDWPCEFRLTLVSSD
jgi:hypothetical protein